MRIRASIVGIALLGTACAGTGEFSEGAPERTPVAAPAESEAAPPRRVGTTDDAMLDGSTNLLVRNYNVTLVVADPLAALDAARTLVLEAGGEVVSSDRQPEYGSINVVAPRGEAERLFLSLRTLGKITNESQGQNDMRAAMHELRTKLRKLELADMTVQQAIRHTDEHEVVDALVTMLELSRRERESSWQQIRSYQQQGRGDQIYINFQSEASVAEQVLPNEDHFGRH